MGRTTKALGVIAIAVCACAAPAAAAPVPLDSAGSSGSGAGQLAEPQGLDVGADGDIYVADSTNHRISVFNADGSFDHTFGFGVDSGSTAFEVCTASCQAGIQGSGAGQLFLPGGVALDGTGNLFVVSPNNNRVDQFDVSVPGAPTFVRAFGFDVDTVDGTFQSCTTGTGCLQGSSGNGLGQLDFPTGIAAVPGALAVADNGNDRVSGYSTATPAPLGSIGTNGTGAGQLSNPQDVAVGSAGEIFVSEQGNERISVFAAFPTPNFTLAWGYGVEAFPASFEVCVATCFPGAPGGAAGQTNFPTGLDVDAEGSLYVAELNNNRVSEFDTSGPTFTRAFGAGVDTGAFTYEVCTTASSCSQGASGNDLGEFEDPVGVAVDTCGAVWVSDGQNNDRIQRFGEPGTQAVPPCTLSPSPSPPSSDFSFGKATLNKKKGTATLPVQVPGPGTLALSGKGIKAASATSLSAAAASLNLTVKAKGSTAKSLKKKGKAKVTANVTFTPTGGTAATLSKKLTLKRKR